MVDQPHFTSYEACSICPNGTIMMMPPAGTVGRDGQQASSDAGRTARNEYVQRIPIALDTAVLARGRNRFDIYCAACHGRLGNGLSQVAENMLDNTAHYVVSENPMVVGRDDLDSFSQDVNQLRDAVARAEKRIELLTRAYRDRN
jgi:mono/diheme cytochrome c family protein